MDTDIGTRIAEARKKAGLTQPELAEKLGVAYPTLNRYETKNKKLRRPISAEMLFLISEITGCDPTWLFTGKDGARVQTERLGEIQKLLTGIVREQEEVYGPTNRDRFWMAFGREIDTKDGAEHLIRAIYEAGRAGHVQVDELLKRYRD